MKAQLHYSIFMGIMESIQFSVGSINMMVFLCILLFLEGDGKNDGNEYGFDNIGCLPDII